MNSRMKRLTLTFVAIVFAASSSVSHVRVAARCEGVTETNSARAEKLIDLLDRFSAVSKKCAEANRVQAIIENELRHEAEAVVADLHENNLGAILDAYLLAITDNDPIVQADWGQLHLTERSIEDLFRCAVYVCNEWPDRNHFRGRWTPASLMREYAAGHLVKILDLDTRQHPGIFDKLKDNPEQWLADVLSLRGRYSACERPVIERIRQKLLNEVKVP